MTGKTRISVQGDDWTEADWRDLHETIEGIKRRVAERREKAKRAKKINATAYAHAANASMLLTDAVEKWADTSPKVLLTWLRTAGDWCNAAAKEVEGEKC